MQLELKKRFPGSIDLIEYKNKLNKHINRGYKIIKVEKDNIPLKEYTTFSNSYKGWYTVTLLFYKKPK
jgi:hypothetical protein